MRRTRLALLYAAFAVVAIAANIGSQHAIVTIYSGAFAITLSILAGTGIGLLVKYVLDKTFIFRYQTTNAVHELRTFILYTVMGLVTTFVFWGTEAAFQWIYRTDFMRYVGGTLGLIIGYIIKYWLDARFVFSGAKEGR